MLKAQLEVVIRVKHMLKAQLEVVITSYVQHSAESTQLEVVITS